MHQEDGASGSSFKPPRLSSSQTLAYVEMATTPTQALCSRGAA
jgi:hypothetical protein